MRFFRIIVSVRVYYFYLEVPSAILRLARWGI